MPDPIPDLTLLAQFQAGDQEAFAALLARYHGLVRAACSRQAAPGEVDDCVQAVFLVLSRRPQAAGRAGNLPGWLLTTTWYVCRRTHRARARRQRAERVAAQQVPTNDGPCEPEALAHLDDCLRRLPESQRAVITLHDLVGQSFEEIADRLGLTRDYVYQLRHRGLGTIRHALARRGFAIGAATVASLFASQAQAACTTSHILVATLCGNPTPAAKTLASGAMTAMTVATTTPFAIAASLIFATGIGTSVLTAEKNAQPPAVTAAAPQPISDGFLDQEVSGNFENQELRTALAEVGQKAGFTPVVAAEVAPRSITIKFWKMKTRHVLAFLSKLSGSEYQVDGTSVRFGPFPDVAAPVGLFLVDVPEGLDQRFTNDFQHLSLADVFVFLQKISPLKIVVAPTLAPTLGSTITLKVRDMHLADVLAWIAQLSSLHMVCQDQTLFVAPGVPENHQPSLAAAFVETDLPAALQTHLAQRVTVDFQQRSIRQIADALGIMSPLNVIVDSALAGAPGRPPLTVALHNQPIRDLLHQVATQATVRIIYRNDALFIFDPNLVRKPDAVPAKPTGKPAEPAEPAEPAKIAF